MQNILFKANVIDPAEELAPSIRITPFSSRHLYREKASDSQINACQKYLKRKIGTFSIQSKARICIEKILDYYNLQPDDVVTVLTTSGNFYISSCVTKAIENFCSWSRVVTPQSKLLLINHEFGYPYQEWDYALSFKLPIIEDCAYTFLTTDENIGKYSDFVIYSLPKAFPMQMGAILKTNVDCIFTEDDEIKTYVLNVLSQEIVNIPMIVSKRFSNTKYYLDRLTHLGINLFFGSIEINIVPGTFLFTWSEEIDYHALKHFMQYNGVECSCFYGKPAFFLPVHQNLTDKEMSYICDLIEYFYKNR